MWDCERKGVVSRKPQYKDVYRRTIEIPQRARNFKPSLLLITFCHSVHRGGRCLPQCMLGYTHSLAGTPWTGVPPGQVHPLGRYIPSPTGTAADGTHPTGMLSCCLKTHKLQRRPLRQLSTSHQCTYNSSEITYLDIIYFVPTLASNAN